jgi:hypothetical protein
MALINDGGHELGINLATAMCALLLNARYV